jgi:hypothetical protein
LLFLCLFFVFFCLLSGFQITVSHYQGISLRFKDTKGVFVDLVLDYFQKQKSNINNNASNIEGDEEATVDMDEDAKEEDFIMDVKGAATGHTRAIEKEVRDGEKEKERVGPRVVVRSIASPQKNANRVAKEDEDTEDDALAPIAIPKQLEAKKQLELGVARKSASMPAVVPQSPVFERKSPVKTVTPFKLELDEDDGFPQRTIANNQPSTNNNSSSNNWINKKTTSFSAVPSNPINNTTTNSNQNTNDKFSSHINHSDEEVFFTLPRLHTNDSASIHSPPSSSSDSLPKASPVLIRSIAAPKVPVASYQPNKRKIEEEASNANEGSTKRAKSTLVLEYQDDDTTGINATTELFMFI